MILRSFVGLRHWVGIAMVVILVAAGCGDGSKNDAEGESSWGPLAVGPAVPNGGDEALIGGVLALTATALWWRQERKAFCWCGPLIGPHGYERRIRSRSRPWMVFLTLCRTETT
ncbi:MAG: hypothetical protein IIB04_01235 [Acidobacteria bacterium]|nr:hypothetical protein [Acidobacteriota bacterium]MCH8985218.1 hypothetical protein [Acidobacteriota bacterium]